MCCCVSSASDDTHLSLYGTQRTELYYGSLKINTVYTENNLYCIFRSVEESEVSCNLPHMNKDSFTAILIYV